MPVRWSEVQCWRGAEYPAPNYHAQAPLEPQPQGALSHIAEDEPAERPEAGALAVLVRDS